MQSRTFWEKTLLITLRRAETAPNGVFENLTISPEVAAMLRESAPAYQRKMDQNNLASIEADLMAGTYVDTGAMTVAFLRSDVRKAPNAIVTPTLIDGNHRTQACVNTGKPLPADVRVVVVETDADLRRLYAKADQGRARNATAVLVANTKDVKTPFTDLNPRVQKLLVKASQWGIVGMDPKAYAIYNNRANQKVE